MGYIKPEIYQSLCTDFNQSLPKIFIETGTFKGGIPARMLDEDGTLEPFDKIYTIELGHDICKIASRRFKLLEKGPVEPNILHTNEMDPEFKKDSTETYCDGKLSLINDDSKSGLQKLLPTINEPCCFWLDAHAGASKYARGEEDCPLLQELDIIAQHDIKNHIIAIDDSNLLGTVQKDEFGNIVCDYSNITLDIVQQKILNINPNYDIGIYDPYDMQMLVAIAK